jgi:aspartate/methionine/tyrosine aminotransferase
VHVYVTGEHFLNIPPFRIEHYYGKYEFSAEIMLSSSDAQSRSLGEILDLEPGSRERFETQWLGYTEAPGAPYLRESVAKIYKTITADDVLMLASAEEGIFVLYHALAGPGDHIIVEAPCYESAIQLARSTGASVSLWQRSFENGWAHDMRALEAMITPATRVIYINTPHNPTGINMPRAVLDQIMDLARARGIVVFCDEVYRELEHDPATTLPAACDLYENAISLGSMSKSYGLAGLRLGWYATRNREVLQRALHFKYYTTICNSAPSEFLSDVALRHRHVLVERNRAIVQRNLPLLTAFLNAHDGLFEWVEPTASPILFARFKVPDVRAACEDIVAKTGVLLLPGDVYDQQGFVRMGYGRTNMPEALERLDAYLRP